MNICTDKTAENKDCKPFITVGGEKITDTQKIECTPCPEEGKLINHTFHYTM